MYLPTAVLCMALLVLPASSKIAKSEAKAKSLEKRVAELSRQLMLQQLFVEERIRTDGSSGLKQSRLMQSGSQPYHADTALGMSVAAIHDHPWYPRTIGMGEINPVLNGVEFTTRHNDYQLNTIARIGKGQKKINFEDVVDIPFPDVPEEVLNAGGLQEQVEEMRAWFKAFADQDHSERDYRKYFKPVMCYLEGYWTESDPKTIDEPFFSTRHHLFADSWEDLQNKLKFTAYTGRQERFQNYAFLPRTIMDVDEDGNMTFAQWNYRILCHPLKQDVPLNRLNVIDDLKNRMAYGLTLEEHENSPNARFRLSSEDSDDSEDGFYFGELLDTLMSVVPGRDGCGAKLTDDGITGDDSTADHISEDKQLNAAYYHRWFRGEMDAMATRVRHRGYSDETLFMAKTTQEKIAPMTLTHCLTDGSCVTEKQRWTYAIPMELIYLTPLHKWNPFKILYKGDDPTTEEAKTVTGKGEDGKSGETAFNGTHGHLFYQTPLAFYDSVPDSAKKWLRWVDCPKGTPHEVMASGIYIQHPEIPGVGQVRTRYPIMPLHQEGGAIWKEIDALKDAIFNKDDHEHMYQ